MTEASLTARIDQDIIAAMKARNAERTSTLRMVKTALKNKEIDKRQPLTDTEAQQILTTLVKQRRESVEQFTKGNRPELAAKETAEIALIETYMPKAAGEEEIRGHVREDEPRHRVIPPRGEIRGIHERIAAGESALVGHRRIPRSVSRARGGCRDRRATRGCRHGHRR